MRYMKELVIFIALLLTTGPVFAAPAEGTTFADLVDSVLDLIQLLLFLLFALTFVAFLWGVVKGWVIGGGGEEGVQKGKDVVLAAIIAFVLMSSIWGIVYIFQFTLFGG